MNSSIFTCIEENNVEEAKKMIDNDISTLIERDEEFMTPLHSACKYGSEPLVKYILQVIQKYEESHNGISILDVNSLDKNNWTPLHWAAYRKHFRVCEILIKESFCIVNCPDLTRNNTPLHFLSSINNVVDKDKFLEVLGLLYTNGSDLNAKNTRLETPIYISCLHGSEVVSSWLLSYHVTVNVRTLDGETPLHAAVKSGNLNIVMNLLNSGAYVTRDNQGISPLDLALQKSFTDIYNAINSNNGITKTKNSLEYEPSLLSPDNIFLNKSQSMIRHLDELGNPWKRTSLHQSVISNNEEETRLILKANSDPEFINMRDQPKGWPPILYAAAYGYLSIAKILIEHHCDIDVRDIEGSSLLHLIARNKQLDDESLGELLSLLVSKKIDLNTKNACGYTALHEAALRNNYVFIKLLVCAGASVNETSDENDSALIFAVREGHLESAKILLHYGAEKDIKGKNGTALDVARKSNSFEMVKILIFDEEEMNEIYRDYLNQSQDKNQQHNHSNKKNIDIKRRTRSRSKELIRRKSMDSLNIPLNIIVDTVIANSIVSHSQKHQSPLAAFYCSCSQSIKGFERESEGILSVWRDKMCFVSLKDEGFAFTVNISTIINIEWDIFIIWSKLIIICADMKIVITKCDELLACKNILDFLLKHKLTKDQILLIHDRPFEESIGSILYPKENEEMHRYPGLPINESIIIHCKASFKQAGQFAHKFIYVTKKRIIFGKRNLIGILFEEMKSIKKIPDRGILVETAKNSYSFTKIDKRDYVFNILEYLWNNKQTDNRIVLISSKSKCSEDLSRLLLNQIKENEVDVYARWILLKGHHRLRSQINETEKNEGKIDIMWTTLKDISTPLLQMRKLIIFYLEEDPKLMECILEVIEICKKEKHFKYFVLVTFDADVTSESYLKSIKTIKKRIIECEIRYTHIVATPSLMQWLLMDFVNIKQDWKLKLPLGDRKLAWLDQRDLVDLVLEIALSNREVHHSKLYFLTGPEALSCKDVCKLITNTIDQYVLYDSISMEDMRKILNDLYQSTPSIKLKNSDSLLRFGSGNENASPIKKSPRHSDNADEIEIYMEHFKYLHDNECYVMLTTLDIIGSSPRNFVDFIIENAHHLKDDTISKFNFYQYESFSNQYYEICDPVTKILDANRFSKSIGSVLANTHSPLLNRLFTIFDREKCGKVSINDYFYIVGMMINGDIDEQFTISSLFIDSDEDQAISINDLRKTNEIIVRLFQRFNLTHSAMKIEEILSPDQLDGFIKDRNGQYKAQLTLDEFYKVYKRNYSKISSLYALFSDNHIESNVYSSHKDVNILNGHPQWDLSVIISIGISKIYDHIQNNPSEKDYEVKSLYNDEFIVTIPIDKDSDNNTWTFTAYAKEIFRQIREIFDIKYSQYIYSLGFERMICHLILGKLTTFYVISSSGRSGSFIWLSFDRKFLIKSVSFEEFQLLRKQLHKFHLHYKKNPNTFISRIYGLYKIVSPKGETTYFVVMSNLFDSVEIHEQYDLKGSTHNRCVGYKDWTSSKALKDMDFNHRVLIGHEKKGLLLEQMEKDTIFLEKMNICDYSLLIGIHYIDPNKNYDYKTRDRSLFKRNMSGILRFNKEDSDNKKMVYCIGLIDVLTEYTLKKKGERAWKSIVHQVFISLIIIIV